MAENGHLVTLGIKPASPSTGFGYIQQGESYGILRIDFPVFRVERFIEKPALEVARQMVTKRQVFMEQRHVRLAGGSDPGRVPESQMPELFAHLMEVEAALGRPDYKAVLEQSLESGC